MGTNNIKFVLVSEFRELISFAKDDIRKDWHACVGENEKITWFTHAIKTFDSLSNIECKRAKLNDWVNYNSVFSRFHEHIDNNYNIWLKANLKSELITNQEYKQLYFRFYGLKVC